MTNKEKKRFLEGYSSCQRRIVGLQNELEEWQTIATNITQKITPVIVNTNDNTSKVERCTIKCIEIQEKILKEIERAEYNRIKIIDAIGTIRDSRQRDIITMRYVNGMSVRQLSYKLDKDTNGIYKIIRNGIKTMTVEEGGNYESRV